MGYDIGYHAVSLEHIQSTFEYILGIRDDLPYLEKAMIAARSRFVANAWGLGVSQYKQKLLHQAMEAAKKEVEAPSFLGRLMGKKTPEPEFPKINYEDHIGNFDSHLHLWGRPFLITQTNEINKLIDQYLIANGNQSKSLAQQQIDFLKPSLHQKIEPDKQPQPDLEGFKHNASWKMDILRKCVEAYPAEVQDQDGQSHNSADLLNFNLTFYVLENVSLAYPTWMDRGQVWPSHLLESAGIRSDYFKSFAQLYPLESHLPKGVTIRNEKTITENYMVGAVVLPEDIERFKMDIRDGRKTIIKQATDAGWDFQCNQVLQKIEECIDYAQKHTLCFIESTDIYSGPMGVMS